MCNIEKGEALRHKSMGSLFVRTALKFAVHTRVFLAITGGPLRHLFPENLRTFVRDPIGRAAGTTPWARCEAAACPTWRSSLMRVAA